MEMIRIYRIEVLKISGELKDEIANLRTEGEQKTYH